ncbi:MAG TPA: type VI secretion system tip protein VgrG [Mucilaginibacter sp.]|nr:type VI secretion system tip protein VgrG [Mucilaginibacter sp.]
MELTSEQSGGLPSFSIKVNGSPISDTYGIYAVNVNKSVNSVSVAKLIIPDGDVAVGTFNASSSAVFIPGNEVSIEAGYDSNTTLIFQGIITAQTIKIDQVNGSVLEVTCHDAAVKMTVGYKTTSFSNEKDSSIISAIISSYSSLSANITSTKDVWPVNIQYNATDWDFIVSTAARNGLVVTALNGKVSVFAPNTNTSSVITISYGDNLLEFNAKLNAVTQLTEVTASAWDYRNQRITSAKQQNNLPGPGNLSSSKLSKVVGLASYDVQTTAPLETSNLATWAKSEMIKSAFSKIQGTAKFQGTSMVEPGKYITLSGLGDRFNGDHFISGVIHDLSDGSWTTTVSIGMSPHWESLPSGQKAPSAYGPQSPAGLFNGTVKSIIEDPEAQYRVLVEIPLFGEDGIWARFSNFYASSGAGVFFLPEVGDEVVLGFLDDDPRFPVVLGSLYSNTKQKPGQNLSASEKNPKKAIISRTGISLEFDDENKVLTINTPDKNRFVLDDNSKKISLTDCNGNSITMAPDGLTIKSAGNIKLEADMKVQISGREDEQIKAGKLSLKKGR